MIFISTFVLSALSLSAHSLPAEKRSVSAAVFNDLARFTGFAEGAYQAVCPSPLGNTLVEQFSFAATSTHGFIARDDFNQKIIISFRGSEKIGDWLLDTEIILIPLVSPGISNSDGAMVHTGFLTAFNSVASGIITSVAAQLDMYPSYTLVATGHSLGGALASLGGLSLKSNIPNSDVLIYSFGQPRTGNPAYATLVENIVGVGNIFRAVHTTDGVPNLFPQALGYRHHATESWNFVDPSEAANVKQCIGEEDPTCSDSVPFMGIDAAHFMYFGQAMGGVDPTVCE